jgi:phosphoglycerate kinase
MTKKSVVDLDLTDKRILIRVDFNVPLDGDTVADDNRIQAALPTLRYLLAKGAALVLMSHLGRPQGRPATEFSLGPVADRLSRLLGLQVQMAPDCLGPQVEALAANLRPGEILLLENLRFHPEEEGNDPVFAGRLASLGQVFVNDAFGTAHRAHASTEGVVHHMDRAVSGLLMEKEIAYLQDALLSPKRPFLAILGGAKISGKVEVIEHLLDRVDVLLIGGGMQFTFFKAMGMEIGDSLLEQETVDVAARVLEQAGEKGVELVLPLDTIAAKAFAADAEICTIDIHDLTAGWQGLDIGPSTCALFSANIAQARTVIWNGPVGVFEMAPFSGGTRAVAEAVADATQAGAISIIGGGDTAAAVNQFGFGEHMSHISTGGGASLECIAGRDLPGVVALDDRD